MGSVTTAKRVREVHQQFSSALRRTTVVFDLQGIEPIENNGVEEGGQGGVCTGRGPKSARGGSAHPRAEAVAE